MEIYKSLDNYDLILMIDVIEHLNKEESIEMLKYFINKNCDIIIATPNFFFEQYLYQSDYERHISYWSKKDFYNIGYVDYQKIDAGIIYLLSKRKKDIRGFGNKTIKRIRRLARAILNEF